jgi:hypothetical protein
MSLINKIVDAASQRSYREVAEQLCRPEQGGVSHSKAHLANFVGQTLNTKGGLSIDDSIFSHVDQRMQELQLRDAFWPFLTPKAPKWFEWRDEMADESGRLVGKKNVGVLIQPLPNQAGFSFIQAIERTKVDPVPPSTDPFMQSAQFYITPLCIFGANSFTQTRGVQIQNIEDYRLNDPLKLQAAMNALGHRLAAVSLLLSSKSSPVVVDDSSETFERLNIQRAKKDLPPKHALRTLSLDVARFHIIENQPPTEPGDPNKRVEHEVRDHFKCVGKEVLYVDSYVRYKGSEKGSTVGKPRKRVLARGHETSHSLRNAPRTKLTK